MRRLLTLLSWPLAPQLAVAAALAALVLALVLGEANPETNPGMYLLWGLWWPLVPLSFFLAGRLWCAVCPVSLLGDGAARALPRRPPLPAAVGRHAAVLLVVSFGAVHLANLWFRFEENLPGSIALLGALGTAAFAATLACRGRDWCTALCPLGAMGRFLARLSPLRIAGGSDACAKPCAARACEGGGAGGLCPVGIDLRGGIDPGACILCGACLKACQRLGAVGWQRRGGGGAPAVPAGESLAALAFLGLAIDMALTHLVDWPILFWQLTTALGVAAGAWTETGLHVAIMAAPLLLALALSPLRGAGRSVAGHLSALAAATLPLAGAGLLAVTLRPLIVEGPLRLQGLLLGWGVEGAVALSALHRLDGVPMRALQVAVVVAGLLASLAASLRESGEGGATGAAGGAGARMLRVAFVLGAGAVLLWICSRPMSG